MPEQPLIGQERVSILSLNHDNHSPYKCKILVTTYKCITGKAPEYLCELLSIRRLSRVLRSSNQLLLQMPVSKFKSYGEGAFSVPGPTLWNRLPEEVRNKPSLESFKLLLKTHLLKIAFLN